jgi:hypothetical protein
MDLVKLERNLEKFEQKIEKFEKYKQTVTHEFENLHKKVSFFLSLFLLFFRLFHQSSNSYFQYFQRNPKLADASRRLKSQIWSSVVTILLVEAKGLPPTATDAAEELFVKFR